MRYKNKTDNLIKFDLKGKQVEVFPGDFLEIDNELDYVISSCGVKLTVTEEVDCREFTEEEKTLQENVQRKRSYKKR